MSWVLAKPFYEQPILNSPYGRPSRHHALDAEGQPLDLPPVEGRRRSSLITPVPKAKKQRGRPKQGALSLGDPRALSTEEQAYNPTPIINEIRSHVETWRGLKNPADWGVTPVTQRLLQHWRNGDFHSVRPFFCQVEAVETTIWLTEVAARQRQYAHIWRHIRGANEEANPELLRLALKMATGAGKTTVMAMLIAWQTLNAAAARQLQLQHGLPDRYAGHHHPRPAARAPARRPGRLLRQPRAGARRHADGPRQGQDRADQLTTRSSGARRWRSPRSAAAC